MNTTRIGRSIAALSICTAAFAVSACGADIEAPAHDVGVELSEPTKTAHYEPACNTPAAVKPCPEPTPAPNRRKIDAEFAQ